MASLKRRGKDCMSRDLVTPEHRRLQFSVMRKERPNGYFLDGILYDLECFMKRVQLATS